MATMAENTPAQSLQRENVAMSTPGENLGEKAGTENEAGQDAFAKIMANHKPNPMGSGYLQLYLFSSLIFMCSTMNGYDSSLMGSINALPNYTRYYQLPENGNASTGIVFAIFQVGQMAGALFIWMADWRGRRQHIFMGCLGVCVATIITSTAKTLSIFIGGRFLLSFFATCAHTAAPLFLVEIAPPQYRGTVAGLYNTYTTWLIAKDRHEEARRVITKYHANGDDSHPLVALEMMEMTESLRDEEGCQLAWFGQFSGNNVISYYLPTLLKNVGIRDTNTQLLLNIVYALTGWIAATAGTRFHDIAGRRKMFMFSTTGMIVCLALTAATAAVFVHNGSTTASSASIAFIYLFGVIFAFAYTSMQPIYPAEVMSNDMRAKGMGTFKLTAGAAGFVNTFAAPIALTNIGYWFYVFFVFWDVFELGFIYFFFVETKGRTLEELDAVFEAKNPRKASVAITQAEKDSAGVARSTSIAV